MPQRKYLNVDEQEIIIDLKLKGNTCAQIAKSIIRHPTTVKKYLDSPTQYGKSILKSGRKSKLSNRQKRSLINSVGNKKESLREAARSSKENISHMTVWRTIQNSNLIHTKMLSCPILTKTHKLARVQFAKSVLLKGKQYWESIIFSDEKRFCLDGPDGYKYYWHDIRKEKRICSKNQYSQGVMVWIGISNSIERGFTFVEGKINSKKYQEILKHTLLPICDKNVSVFQQDNATPHKSKDTLTWLKDNGINVIDWPAKSPDLNIVENIWGIISNLLYSEKINYESIPALKEAIKKQFDLISLETISNLYESFPNRLTDVLLRKGGFLTK